MSSTTVTIVTVNTATAKVAVGRFLACRFVGSTQNGIEESKEQKMSQSFRLDETINGWAMCYTEWPRGTKQRGQIQATLVK